MARFGGCVEVEVVNQASSQYESFQQDQSDRTDIIEYYRRNSEDHAGSERSGIFSGCRIQHERSHSFRCGTACRRISFGLPQDAYNRCNISRCHFVSLNRHDLYVREDRFRSVFDPACPDWPASSSSRMPKHRWQHNNVTAVGFATTPHTLSASTMRHPIARKRNRGKIAHGRPVPAHRQTDFRDRCVST